MLWSIPKNGISLPTSGWTSALGNCHVSLLFRYQIFKCPFKTLFKLICYFLYQDERFPGGIGLEGNITLTCVTLVPCWFYSKIKIKLFYLTYFIINVRCNNIKFEIIICRQYSPVCFVSANCSVKRRAGW